MTQKFSDCARCPFIISERLCLNPKGKAPCTVLAVKDRVLGHNPLAAVYNIDNYYRSLKPSQS